MKHSSLFFQGAWFVLRSKVYGARTWNLESENRTEILPMLLKSWRGKKKKKSLNLTKSQFLHFWSEVNNTISSKGCWEHQPGTRQRFISTTNPLFWHFYWSALLLSLQLPAFCDLPEGAAMVKDRGEVKKDERRKSLQNYIQTPTWRVSSVIVSLRLQFIFSFSYSPSKQDVINDFPPEARKGGLCSPLFHSPLDKHVQVP